MPVSTQEAYLSGMLLPWLSERHLLSGCGHEEHASGRGPPHRCRSAQGQGAGVAALHPVKERRCRGTHYIPTLAYNKYF